MLAMMLQSDAATPLMPLQDVNGKTAKEIASSDEALELLGKPDLAYTY